jgi:hypothetical protein
MRKIKGGSSGLNYKDQIIYVLVFFICLHSLLDVLIWTDQIKFVGTDAKNILGILIAIIVAALVAYLSYIMLQNDSVYV